MIEERALLLTDVVDSTHLSTLLGDQDMARLWLAHDRVARDLLPPHGGREIDKTDGMLLMFEQASHALAYAAAYHAALATLHIPLKARAGLHVGPVILRENPPEDVARGAKPLEVEGLAKPTAARVMALARGGQTLLSAEALQALGAIDARVQSHGHWQMKGVAEPLELFEIGDGPFTAPPDHEKSYRVARIGERWLPIRQVPNNLPEQLSSFVGRERELDEIKTRLQQVRLLTLLGMGGLGKTRLSLQAADELRAEFPDGVWFLDLAPLRDGALVAAEAAQVLGVRELPGGSLLQTLAAHLKTRRCLIVMDNCEHLLRPCAQFAYALLKAAPQLRLLASSREALRVPGEQSYAILPLPVPGRDDSLALLARSTAVRLFVERVQQHRHDYALTAQEAPAVAELVARLEGIPLALELAAARVRMFSVAEINRRLDDRYRELVDGDIVLDERQQTLRGLVDWSYDMLEENERCLLRRLGVFAGGWDLAAAEAVCGVEPLVPEAVAALLQSLAEKSLLAPDGMTRYRMLETIRDYALGKLAAAGEGGEREAAHCRFFFDLAKQGRNGMQGPQQGEWVGRLELDQDNLRSAMRVAQTDDGRVDPLIAVKMVVALQNFWIMCGRAGEGRASVRTMLAMPAIEASPMARAHALYVGGTLAWSQSDLPEALRLLDDCLQLRRGLDSPADLAAALSTLAVTHMSGGDAARALEAGHEALSLFRQCGYRQAEAIALLQLGQAHASLDELAPAREQLGASLALAREIGHPETEGEAQLMLAELDLIDGDRAAAERGFAQSLAVCAAAGDRRGAANALWQLGRVDLLQGRLKSARERLGQALADFHGYEMREQLLDCLQDHAALALRLGEPVMAVQLVAASQSLREQARLQPALLTRQLLAPLLPSLRAACPDEQFDELWQQGRGWDVHKALLRAQSL